MQFLTVYAITHSLTKTSSLQYLKVAFFFHQKISQRQPSIKKQSRKKEDAFILPAFCVTVISGDSIQELALPCLMLYTHSRGNPCLKELTIEIDKLSKARREEKSVFVSQMQMEKEQTAKQLRHSAMLQRAIQAISHQKQGQSACIWRFMLQHLSHLIPCISVWHCFTYVGFLCPKS